MRVFPLAFALMFVAVACEPDDPTAAEKDWTMVYEQLPAALLSTWGSSPDDIFFVGSDPSDGKGPLVLHWDGDEMSRLPTGASGNLWWVFGSGANDPVYMSGSGGLALRYERGTKTFTRLTGVPNDVTLFGIMPVPGGRVWAAGGQRSTGKVYVLDGTTFSEVTDLPAPGGANNAFNKIWGRSEDDLWLVGIGQRAFHRTASGWQALDTLGEAPLFTVHGNADETLAVGGFVEGKVLEMGDDVDDVSPVGASRLNGVWLHPDGIVTAVGAFGEVWQRRGGDTWRQEAVPTTVFDFHSVFVDSAGDIWAVGGQIATEPLRLGMLLHFGSKTISPVVPE